ncbi:MAG: RHS repeat-associated core domain-containing protein [Desulfobacteraceae bacterium]|jgi:RHS repeat-associated protein
MCRKIDVFEEKDESGETFENEYITDYFYTPTGKVRKIIAPQNQIKTFKYDELDRLVCENDNGKITRYTYDSRNNQLTLVDAEYNTTRFEYYKNNLLKSKTMPNGQKEYYYYNANGQIKYLVDPKKQVVKKQYFGNGELEKESYFEAIPALSPSVLADVESKVAGKTPVKVVSYTYDKVGNPKTYTDGTTSGVYTYDNLYRLHDETINYGAFSLSNTYDYYKNGLPKSLTGPDNIKYDYSYNKLQLTDVAIPGQGTVTFSDYKWNSAQKILLPGGTEFTYSYDDLMRLTGISSKAAGKAVMNYTYAYDSLSRITDKKTEHGNYAYGYDDHHRLTSVTSPVFGNESFTYDDVGNRKTSGETAGTHQYSNNNELLRLDALSGAILPQQYHYNTSGSLLNTTSQSPTLTDKSFTYDVTDRLTKVQNAAKTQTIADYSYDPFGRRLWKEVNGVKTYYFYSSQGLSGEYNASGQVIKTYGYLPGSAWTTDPLFMKVGESYYYYHNDHLGTPVKMTSSNGAVVWSANYKAFGEAVVAPSSTVENNLRFPGQYFDKETGLHYNWNRYYDPKAGRYIGPDPLGFGGGDVNLYAYSVNNPVMVSDPTGLYGDPLNDFAMMNIDIPVPSDNINLQILFDYAVNIDIQVGQPSTGMAPIDVEYFADNQQMGQTGNYNMNGERTVLSSNFSDPANLLLAEVTISIDNRKYSSTGKTLEGTIVVTSDVGPYYFSGYTMENAKAGDKRNKPPIEGGIYEAFVRTDHNPIRVQLKFVPEPPLIDYIAIQIHNGSYPANYKGCFGVGTGHSTDFLSGTVNSINIITNIIKYDGTGNIKVIVGPRP